NGPHGFYFGRPELPESKEAARLAVAFFQERFKQAANGPAAGAAAPSQRGSLDWVDPDRPEPEGTKYKTFRSRTLHPDVSSLIYLPPGYDDQQNARYPVLYYLHGSNGMPRGGGDIVRRLDKAIRSGRA